MKNSDTTLGWKYHDLTKHSFASIRRTRHYLDWSNQPSQFKIYPEIEPIPLPTDLDWTGVPALAAAASPGWESSGPIRPTLSQLASILLYSAGVTREKTYPEKTIYFRAAACAGALYPMEVYVVCREVESLEAGVYHFNPGDFSLRRLREGDHRSVVVEATASESHVATAPVILIYSAISWRSTWKYRDRAYRYHFWDCGMILANALAMAAAHGIPAEVVAGFVESDLDKLIGIDGENELALCLLTLGRGLESPSAGPTAARLVEVNPEVIPLSESPVDYPAIREMHHASSLADKSEVAAWRSITFDRDTSVKGATTFDLSSPGDDQLPRASIEEVIERRGSTRRFARKAIPLADLSVILERSSRGIRADFLDRASRINDLYLIVNRVEGLEPGAYFYREREGGLELLKPGEFSQKASYLTLDQELGGDASATLFFMTDLESVFRSFGNRGYRAAQLEAGIIGGKIYLVAYSMKRGATGLTFFDDDVTEFFSPHAAGKSCIFVMSVGIPGKRLVF